MSAISIPALPISSNNIYFGLNHRILSIIAAERDIEITGAKSAKIKQLAELDEIMPEWLDSIKAVKVENIQSLDGIRLLMYAKIHGLNINIYNRFEQYEFVTYVRLCLLLKQGENRKQRYGIIHKLVEMCNIDVLQYVLSTVLKLQHEAAAFMDDVDVRRYILAIARGENVTIDVKQYQDKIDRYHYLLDSQYVVRLEELYNQEINDDFLIELAKRPPHPLEDIILNIDDYDIDELIKSFGIVVPKGLEEYKFAYVFNNISQYKHVATRTRFKIISPELLIFTPVKELIQYINSLTDIEIFQYIKVFVAYRSRAQLVNYTSYAIKHPIFMLPLVRDTYLAKNKETLFCTSILDTETFMVAYGCVFGYRLYELDELINAFHKNDKGIIIFRKPENLQETFTKLEIIELIALLEALKLNESSLEAFNKLKAIMQEYDEQLESDGKILQEFEKIKDKGLLKDFLEQLIYTGMYMRRWEGPGHPYPLTRAETEKSFDPNDKVCSEIITLQTILNKMSKEAKKLCHTFNSCEYVRGKIFTGGDPFMELFNDVIKGEDNGGICIRESNTIFIGTAHHYLKLLFNYIFPGLNVKEVVYIN